MLFCFMFNNYSYSCFLFFFQAEDGIRDRTVTGVQTCALPISLPSPPRPLPAPHPTRPTGGRASPVPRPASPVPSLCVRVALHAIVDAHEPAESTHARAEQGEQRPGVQPTVHQPPQRAEQQDGEGEREPQRDVGVALAEAPAEAISIVGGHDAGGNICACENFRKQRARHATLCGAWEYDVLT